MKNENIGWKMKILNENLKILDKKWKYWIKMKILDKKWKYWIKNKILDKKWKYWIKNENIG